MADDMFAPPSPADVSFEEMLACVDRELKMRRQGYPRWVSNGKLTKATADLEILKMRAVRAALIRGEALEKVWDGLGPGDPVVDLAAVDDVIHDLQRLYPEPQP